MEKPQTIKSLDEEINKCILGCKICKPLCITLMILMWVSFGFNWNLGCIVCGIFLLSYQLLHNSLNGKITNCNMIKIEVLRRNKEKRKGGKK